MESPSVNFAAIPADCLYSDTYECRAKVNGILKFLRVAEERRSAILAAAGIAEDTFSVNLLSLRNLASVAAIDGGYDTDIPDAVLTSLLYESTVKFDLDGPGIYVIALVASNCFGIVKVRERGDLVKGAIALHPACAPIGADDGGGAIVMVLKKARAVKITSFVRNAEIADVVQCIRAKGRPDWHLAVHECGLVISGAERAELVSALKEMTVRDF